MRIEDNGVVVQDVCLLDSSNVAIGSDNPLPVKGVDLSVATAISGQITVTTAGTEVQGGNVPLTNGVLIKALGANTGKMYVGNDGTGAIASTTGYELSADQVIFVQVDNLNKLWFDSSVNGEKVCWLKA